jgi:DNA polymerase III subunit epsilon
MMPADLNQLVIVDVETSGTDPLKHQILSAAFVPFNNHKTPFEIYIRPSINIEWNAVAYSYFQNYKTEWETKAVSPQEAFKQITNYLETFDCNELTLVGHNVAFDIAFLRQIPAWSGFEKFQKLSHRTLDTHTLLKVLEWLDKVPRNSNSSSSAFEAFKIDIATRERHTALGDAVATRTLFEKVLERLGVQMPILAL